MGLKQIQNPVGQVQGLRIILCDLRLYPLPAGNAGLTLAHSGYSLRVPSGR